MRALLACSSGMLLSACSGDDPGTVPSTDPSSTATDSAWASPEGWLCRPDLDDPCDGSLDVTAVAADGSREVMPYRPAVDPIADCFYVYPTTSLDPGPQADLEPGPEEAFVVANQAARYGAVCRLFAPMYRQVSIDGLFAGEGDFELAYADVRDAFRSYLARDAGDRPFLLIGHSQGAAHLARLIAEEIEPDPELHRRLVSAHLLGGFVTVPTGEPVGGTFASTPTCGAPTDTGCVVHYNAFRADEPPEEGAFFGLPPAPGQSVACTHPAALSGGPAPLGTVLPAEVPSDLLALIGLQPGPFSDPAAAPLDTPYYALPGLLHGECVAGEGASYLAVTIDADPTDPRADDIGGDLLPGWGLHLVDVNLASLDLIALAEQQIARF